jgi:4-amino-4-deoxy-L-arabinose transferase-like glycosyltransferase
VVETAVIDRQGSVPGRGAAWSAAERLLTRFRGAATAVPPAAIATALIVVAIAIHIPTLNQPLVETEAFRQTTTAYPALIYHEQGIDVLRPQVPVFGPPFTLPIEFPLFQAAASVVMDLGAPPDAALRFTALVCFLITALLVWRLLVALADDAAGLAGLAAFLFSPLGLIVSRMSLIEYMATAGALALVLWGLYWHSTGKRVWYFAAMAAGAVGLLVKPTTSVMYLVPLMVLVLVAWRRGDLPVARRSVYGLAIVALFGIPLLLAGGWTLYADGVRASNPFSLWFSSSGGVAGYYLGTLRQKLDPSTWFDLADEAQLLLFGGALWLWGLLALGAALLLSRRAFAVSLVLSAAIGPLLFTNQYLIVGQEYYMAALSPLVAIAIGLAAGWIWREREHSVARVVLLSLVLGWAITLHLTQGYWGRQFTPGYDPSTILPAADYVAAHTQPDELVALGGQDWDPSIFYYARRKGLMVRGRIGSDTYVQLRALGYTRLFWCPGGGGAPTTCSIIDITAQ